MKKTILLFITLFFFVPQLVHSGNAFTFEKIKKQIAKDQKEREEIFGEIMKVVNYEVDCTNIHILNSSREAFWTFSYFLNLDNLVKKNHQKDYYNSAYTWLNNQIKSTNVALRKNHPYIKNPTLLYLIDKWIKRTNEMKNSYDPLNFRKN